MLRTVSGGLVLGALLAIAPAAFANDLSPLICANPGSTTASDQDTAINANSCTDFAVANSGQPQHGLNNWLYGYYPQGVLNPATFTLLNPTAGYPASGEPIANIVSNSWSVDPSRYWTSLDASGGHANAFFTDLHMPPFCNSALYSNCGAFTGIDTRGGASSGSADQLTARRYVVPTSFNGNVDITMTLQKDPRITGLNAQPTVHYIIKYSGGIATVLAVVVLPVNFDPNLQDAPLTSEGIKQPLYSVALNNISVKAGDVIDFVAAADFNGSPNFDNFTDFQDAWFELDTIKSHAGASTGIPDSSELPEPASWTLVAGAGLLYVWRHRAR